MQRRKFSYVAYHKNINITKTVQEQKYSIKQWAKDDRPREKLLSKGSASLSDSELLAILISTGSREKSAIEQAKDILKLVKDNLNE